MLVSVCGFKDILVTDCFWMMGIVTGVMLVRDWLLTGAILSPDWAAGVMLSPDWPTGAMLRPGGRAGVIIKLG